MAGATRQETTERLDAVVIGSGQTGLAAGYYLQAAGKRIAIIDSSARVGDNWRSRWDSLHLFTPARHDGLPGWRFPAPGWSFPSKDEMGDYLEAYAERFSLPVELETRVNDVHAHDGRYVVSAGGRSFEADNVVVASGGFETPFVPAFAGELDDAIVQLHSTGYRNQTQLQPGGVLVVGAGNSGAEVAIESAAGHATSLSGRHPGHIPFRMEGMASRLVLERLVLRFVFHRVLTTGTPMGRRMKPKTTAKGTPLIRLKPKDIEGAGVETVPRVAGVRDGLPMLDDGRVLDVTNVVWCTGFRPDFSWIDLPGVGEGMPAHDRGIVGASPGLYFLGLDFLYSLSSVMIHAADRDAHHVVNHIVRRSAGSS
jgi:putative flavoprotein involved in K+ transport